MKIMKKYLFIVLFIGVCFGQDVYPYFSDMEKQLEFERRKIVIEEGESTQQIISGGGSEFNLWSLVIDSEPTYKNAPIKTKYRYNSYFNLQRDGKDISEIEMLRTIGLNDEANKIISEFEKEILLYENSPVDTLISYKYNVDRDKAKFHIYWSFILTLGLINGSIEGSEENDPFILISIIYGGWSINKWSQIIRSDYYYTKKSITKPVLQQQLNPVQTKSMVEAYNRKLHSEIANK